MRARKGFGAVLFLLLNAPAFAATINFSYTLPAGEQTSAGVYSTSSTVTLVRTLWSGTAQSAGLHSSSWDGNLDDGTAAPAGAYTIKVLYNNVAYTWQGVIGNTSSVFTSNTRNIYESLNWMTDMAFSTGPTGFMAVGYNETTGGLYSFNVSDPQTPNQSNALGRGCACATWGLAASDASHVYFTNTGGWDYDNNSFTKPFNLNGTQATFSAAYSTTVTMGQPFVGQTFSTVIDTYSEVTTTGDPVFVATHTPTGLAVQQSSNTLAIAHAGMNLINLYDKNTGMFLSSITVTSPGRIAFAPNGDLWAIASSSAVRFAVATLGQTNTPVTTITGFQNPLGIGVDPSNGDVMIADGGTNQQVLRFTSAGAPVWTLGSAGGYATDPTVTNNKFWFTYGVGGIPWSFIAVQSDGSFWLSDGGNMRTLHFDSLMNYLGKIAYINADYIMTADPNNPTRIFAQGNLEYDFDYTKTLLPGDPDPAVGGNGSWKLAKNWAGGYPSYFTNNQHLHFVVTLSSGGTTKTLGLLTFFNPPAVPTYADYQIVELPASGPMNVLYGPVTTPANPYAYIAPSGDLRTSATAGGVITFTSKAFHGFSGGIPQWSGSVTIATASANNGDPASTGAWEQPWFNIGLTSSNVVVSFNAHQGTTTYRDYHLGGVPLGGSAWSFKTSVAANITYPDEQGTFPTQASYGGHNGNAVWVVGNNIFWNYDGQYGNFSNQFAHYNDDGLFIGQFGVSTRTAVTMPAGYTANYGDAYVLRGGDGNLWAFSSDEAVHSGIHAWKISNINSITEVSGLGTLGQSGTLNLGLTYPPASPRGLQFK